MCRTGTGKSGTMDKMCLIQGGVLEDRACIHMDAGPGSASFNYSYDAKGSLISTPAPIHTGNCYFFPLYIVYRPEPIAACWMCVCFGDDRLCFVSALPSQEAAGSTQKDVKYI